MFNNSRNLLCSFLLISTFIACAPKQADNTQQKEEQQTNMAQNSAQDIALAEKAKNANPEYVALEFSKALVLLDFEKANTFANDSTKQLLDILAALANSASQQDKELAQYNVQFIKEAKCTVNNNTAVCIICCNENGKSQEAMDLVKEGDKWTVSIKKENHMN